MATQTTNLGLTLPIGTEQVSRQVINENMRKIDESVGAVPEGKNLQEEIEYIKDHLTDLIDDEAGIGDDDKVWSADKSATEITGLKSAIGTVPTGKTVEGQIEELQTGKADVIDVTLDTPASVMTFLDGADGMPMAVKIGIEPVQELYGMPYPYPAGATNNMIPDGTDINNGYVNNSYLKSDGTTASATDMYISEYFPVTVGETYTFSNKLGTAKLPSVCFYDENKTFISGVNANRVVSRTIEVPADAVYARCSQYKNSSYESMGNLYQFELGSVATTPMWYSNICHISGRTGAEISVANGDDPTAQGYNVDEYQITFPSEAGTVYGGTLEVYKDGTGKLNVDYGFYTITGDESFTDRITQQNRTYFTLSAMEASTGLTDDKVKCNIFKKNATTSQYSGNTELSITIGQENQNITINCPGLIDGVTDLASLIVWLKANPVTFTYPLATPVEYAMTAAEVNALLTSLKGVNNLWADTGDMLSVEYSADTKLYVDQQIAEKVSASQRLMELIVTANHEDTMTATKAYSSGDLLIVNGTLYKASASIANGATLTEGTNVTATTVAAEIAALA